MRRREFIVALGGAAAWPLAVRAQQPERMRGIGVIMNTTADDSVGQTRIAAFLQGLQQLGWSVGRNVQIDTRWAAGDADRIRTYAAELVGLAPDVILATGSATVGPVQRASRAVPIVFVTTIDPVGGGFVESLARPGTNATGFSAAEYGMSGKWLELLKQIAPRVTRVGVVRDPEIAAGAGQFGAIQSVAPTFGVELHPLGVRTAGEIERAITAFARSANDGLIVTPSALTLVHRAAIIALAARHKLPAIATGILSPPAALSPMDLTESRSTGRRLVTSIAFSKERNRLNCQCRPRPNMNWRSISRPRRRLASTCHTRCSPAPTR